MLEEWMAAAKAELGLDDLVVDSNMLLDLTRDVAHCVARPAAPLSLFLVGYAAASAGGRLVDVDEATAKLSSLAARWEPRG